MKPSGHVWPRALCERVGTAADLLSALVQLRIHYAVRGDCERALEYSEEIWRLAEREQAPDYFLHANAAFAVSHYYRGALQLSCDHSIRVREAYDFERHRHLSVAMGADPLVLSLGHEATALWFQGYPQQALDKVEECGALADRIGQPAMQALARFFACVLRVLRRDMRDAEQAAEALIEFSQERELPDWLNWAKNIHGWALEHRGDHQGLEIIEQGIAAAFAVRAELMLTLYQILLGQVHLQRGAFAKAQAAVEEGLVIAHRNHEVVYVAELHRLRGEIALLLAPDELASTTGAEKDFQESIRIAQEQQAKSWELRTTLSLARWWASQGRAREARERLTTVYTWFTEGFDTPDLIEARALLDNL